MMLSDVGMVVLQRITVICRVIDACVNVANNLLTLRSIVGDT